MAGQGLAAPPIAWAAAGRALPGQSESGDAFAVVAAGERTLLGVIDGLGHGPEAAAAARRAVATLEGYAGEPLEALVASCHRALLRTRGVVLTLASIHAAERTLTWLGVGNVEGVLLRAGGRGRETVLLRAGVAGYQLPPLRAAVLPLAPGDLLVLATDGIAVDFMGALRGDGPPQQIADRILGRHARATDDALVLVARFLGAAPCP